MGQEIERKFLVDKGPPDLEEYPSYEIVQGYLSVGVDDEVRLRKKRDQYTQSTKKGRGLQRMEKEVRIEKDYFYRCWPETKNRRIEKRRYEIDYNGVLIELDVYYNDLAGLMTAEVEFQTLEQADDFESPHWFGEEVTTDERFKNKNLAVNGLPNS